MDAKNIFSYNVHKNIEQDAYELSKNDNPFALVILLQSAKTEGLQESIEKGIEKGIEESKVAFVKSLLSDTDFDNEK